MAFAAAFSPTPPPLHGASRSFLECVAHRDGLLRIPLLEWLPLSPPVKLQHSPHTSPLCSPALSCGVPDLAGLLSTGGEEVLSTFQLDPLSAEALDSLEGDRTEQSNSCQFAPLLQVRRAQALEASANASMGVAAAETEREQVQDAILALDALQEATTSTDAFAHCLVEAFVFPMESGISSRRCSVASADSRRCSTSTVHSKGPSSPASTRLPSDLDMVDRITERSDVGSQLPSPSLGPVQAPQAPTIEQKLPRLAAAAVADAACSMAEVAASVAGAILGVSAGGGSPRGAPHNGCRL